MPITTAVAMPQPTAPCAATWNVPSGVARSMPNTSIALSGIFSSSAPNCSAITTLGRDTAMLKPRNAVNSSTEGSANARAFK